MAPGKNLINSTDNLVEESLSGHVLTYPHLELHANKKVVLAPNWDENRNKVAVICGGGSGHEPFASGFVGLGMLTASVAGSIYAAPPSSNILHAIKCVTNKNKGGCFVIIPNYTGDCLNFGIAIEKAKCLNIEIEQVIVGEDCSIPKNEQGRAGKRGLCGLILVIKIVGALAEKGKKIDELSKYAQIVVNNMATYGVGLEACSIPGKGLMFDLPHDEIELGLGIHGEVGYKRIKLQTVKEIIKEVLKEIISVLNLGIGSSVAVLINNFGALSQLEQGIVAYETITQLKNKNIKVERVYSGLLMTSLNGSGVHISVLNLPKNERETLLACLDDKTEAPRWPGCSYSLITKCNKSSTNHEKTTIKSETSSFYVASDTYKLEKFEEALIKLCIENASKAIINNEEVINKLDSGCGDGDCGSTLRQLADGILSSTNNLSYKYPCGLLYELSQIAEERMGGTSGALYSLMFTTAATIFVGESNNKNVKQLWAETFRAGINGIMKYGKAQLGDKTMLDVFEPCCKALEQNLQQSYKTIAQKVLSAAKQGCEATKHMIPKAGRASYVKQKDYLKDIDAGAFGALTWIEAIVETIIKTV